MHAESDADLYADDRYADDRYADDLYPDDLDEVHEPDPEPRLRVLVYSDDRLVRRQVMVALGRRPSPDLPALEYVECATGPAVIRQADGRRFDLLVLDGEAAPEGGMGICRQLKDEIYQAPPILVLIGRPQDAWLATWSRADGVVAHPIDAIVLADVVTRLLAPRAAALTP